MTYQESLEYLYTRLPMFQRIGAAALKPSLKNTLDFLERLGDPHHRLKTIHIAGTNGKGTSAHTICSILMESGLKVGLYTSPHLKSFTERIKIDGREISEKAVVAFVEQQHGAIEVIEPSFFEATFVMAMDYFVQEKVDIAVIETGLGGRLDSTNVIQPIVCLITMIGWDHADLLGDTLGKIATEKAGIIKKNTPVVIGADQPEFLHIFQERTTNLEAPLYTCNDILIKQKSRRADQVSVEVSDTNKNFTLTTDITARYYQKNIPGILKVIQVLNESGVSIPQRAIERGFERVKTNTGLKGRWQILQNAPMLIADISHNQPGLQELFDQVNQISHKQLHLIFGVVRDKDISKIALLLPRTASYYFTQSSVPRSLPAVELKTICHEAGLSGGSYPNVNDAIQAANKVADRDDLILVCGSTFVVAEIVGL